MCFTLSSKLLSLTYSALVSDASEVQKSSVIMFPLDFIKLSAIFPDLQGQDYCYRKQVITGIFDMDDIIKPGRLLRIMTVYEDFLV